MTNEFEVKPIVIKIENDNLSSIGNLGSESLAQHKTSLNAHSNIISSINDAITALQNEDIEINSKLALKANINDVVDTSYFITATSENTLTNKTLDANGTGNSISNLELNDFAQNVVLTSLSATPSDTSVLTEKAVSDLLDLKVNINSPTFTGSPSAPTPENNDNSTKIATTAYVKNNISSFITSSVNNLSNYTKTSDLATVATSGSYNDLINKPTIPSSAFPTTTYTDLTIGASGASYSAPADGWITVPSATGGVYVSVRDSSDNILTGNASNYVSGFGSLACVPVSSGQTFTVHYTNTVAYVRFTYV